MGENGAFWLGFWFFLAVVSTTHLLVDHADAFARILGH